MINRFVFIAVNYNGFHHTVNFINSINAMKKDEGDVYEIIIVDNLSKREDVDAVDELVKGIKNAKLIRSDVNLGYFRGLNLGIKNTDVNPDSQILVCNNDLVFDENFVTNLKKIDYEDDIMLIAPNIITREGRQQNPHVLDGLSTMYKFRVWLYFTNYYVAQFLRLINQTVKRIRNKPPVLTNNVQRRRIKRGIGACYVLTPNFFKHFDQLDDRIFLWGEEALLTHQIETVNGSTLYDPSIIIHHYESASVSAIQSKKKYYIVKESYKIYGKYL